MNKHIQLFKQLLAAKFVTAPSTTIVEHWLTDQDFNFSCTLGDDVEHAWWFTSPEFFASVKYLDQSSKALAEFIEHVTKKFVLQYTDDREDQFLLEVVEFDIDDPEPKFLIWLGMDVSELVV